MTRRVNPLVALVANLALERLGFSEAQAHSTESETTQEPEIGDLKSISTLRQKDGSVSVLIGRRESGKTVLGYRLAELLGRPIYAVSPEETPPKGVIELGLEELDEKPPPNSTLFLDDLPVYMGTHDYQNQLVRTVEKLVPVVRHRRKLHLIFATQLAALSDKYALDADCVFLKPPSLLYQDLERAAVKRFQDDAAKVWEGKTDFWVRRHCYVLSHQERVFARVQKPEFM